VIGKIGASGNTAYCSSKFAMEGFFDSLRIELMGSGVSVTMIYPGFVITEFAEKMKNPDGSMVGKKGKRIYSTQMMKPDKCAKIILNAATKRKRQVVMTFYGVLGVWMGLLFPRLLDRILKFADRFRKL